MCKALLMGKNGWRTVFLRTSLQSKMLSPNLLFSLSLTQNQTCINLVALPGLLNSLPFFPPHILSLNKFLACLSSSWCLLDRGPRQTYYFIVLAYLFSYMGYLWIFKLILPLTMGHIFYLSPI